MSKHHLYSKILHNLMGHQDQVVVDIGLLVVVVEMVPIAPLEVVIMELLIYLVDLLLEVEVLMELGKMVMME